MPDYFGKALFYAVIEFDKEYNVRSIDFIKNPWFIGYRPGEYFAQYGIDYVVVREGCIVGIRARIIFRSRGMYKYYYMENTYVNKYVSWGRLYR